MEVLEEQRFPLLGSNGSNLRQRGTKSKSDQQFHSQISEPENIDPSRFFFEDPYFKSSKVPSSTDLETLSRKYHSNAKFCAAEDGSTMGCVGRRTGPQLPFLMLTEDLGKRTTEFFNLSDGIVCTINLPPELRSGRCIGSSLGWLLVSKIIPIKSNNLFKEILMFKKKVQIENSLFNPLLKQVVQLPSQKTLPYHPYTDCQLLIRKVALSSAPTSDNIAAGKCMVAIIFPPGRLAFCRPGDASWTILDGENKGYKDIVFYEGKLHAITNQEQLCIFNAFGVGEVTKVNMIPPTDRQVAQPIFFKHGQKVSLGDYLSMYLVESNGELLMVLRIWKYGPEFETQLICPIKAVLFKVFKYCRSGPKWDEIESLGDQMLFLGTSCSKSYSATEFPGFVGNAIYFTDDNFDIFINDEERLSEFRDLGVYRLDSGCIEPCLPCSFSSFSSRYMWLEPSYVG